MHSHLEFRSRELLDDPAEGSIRGELVARLLAEQLPKHDFQVELVQPEDWGWRVEVANASFPLWIGCGYYEEYPDGHLCFIEPSKPYVRRWLKRVPTSEAVERLAVALEATIRESRKAHDLRWWSDAEIARG